MNVTDVTDQTYVLDVREDDEWAAGHMPDAVHIPMSGLLDRVSEVPREGAVAVVCKVGSRSAQVAAYLRQQGWTNVENLEGGVVAWVQAGKPFVTDDGSPASVL
jgi:rhodanese-related sulfurtransferase